MPNSIRWQEKQLFLLRSHLIPGMVGTVRARGLEMRLFRFAVAIDIAIAIAFAFAFAFAIPIAYHLSASRFPSPSNLLSDHNLQSGTQLHSGSRNRRFPNLRYLIPSYLHLTMASGSSSISLVYCSVPFCLALYCFRHSKLYRESLNSKEAKKQKNIPMGRGIGVILSFRW